MHGQAIGATVHGQAIGARVATVHGQAIGSSHCTHYSGNFMNRKWVERALFLDTPIQLSVVCDSTFLLGATKLGNCANTTMEGNPQDEKDVSRTCQADVNSSQNNINVLVS